MGFNEVTGNMWNIPADAYCITTNGFVKKDGKAVMGRGVALEAAKKYPLLPKVLGYCLTQNGNMVFHWGENPTLIMFPVKDNWWEAAKLSLIERSAHELMILTDKLKYDKVLLPRPGCGNGRLKWEDVKQVLEPILDERIWVVNK